MYPSCEQNVRLVMEALTMLRDVSSRMDTDVEGWHYNPQCGTPFMFTGCPGRPVLDISSNKLMNLIDLGFTATEIAALLCVFVYSA